MCDKTGGLYQLWIISVVLTAVLEGAHCSSNDVKTKSRIEMQNIKLKALP